MKVLKKASCIPPVIIRKTVFGLMSVAALVAMNNTPANAGGQSQCYDHWNGDAWHGSKGWALVMCLDSQEMVHCEVRKENYKITDLHTHIALDRGRVIWTDYSPLSAHSYNWGDLTVVCKGANGLHYSFPVANHPPEFWDWGACGPGTDVGGDACLNDQVENRLKVVFDGSGDGAVLRSSDGALCTSTNTSETCYHLPGEPVTLTARVDQGSVFLGWSGEGCSGTDTCTVGMAQNRTVTAKFVKVNQAPVNLLLDNNTGPGDSPAGN